MRRYSATDRRYYNIYFLPYSNRQIKGLSEKKFQHGISFCVFKSVTLECKKNRKNRDWSEILRK